MPRRSEPWFKASHAAWYSRIDGKLVRLGADKRDAFREFHRLMSRRGPRSERPSLPVVLDLWLGSRETRVRPATMESYRHFAQRLTDFLGKVPVEDLRPLHFSQWLDAHPEWSQSTRALARDITRTAFRWAKREGWIDDDPTEGFSVRRGGRRLPVPAERIRALLPVLPEFVRVVVEFLLETGVRPGEALSIRRDRIDEERSVVEVEGKTGRRTVVLSDRALELLRGLPARNGKVFRNAAGAPLVLRTLQGGLRTARDAAGVAGITLYHCRGAFASELVRRGVDSAIVARLLGHSDVKTVTMLYRHYLDVDLSTLRGALATKKNPAGTVDPRGPRRRLT